MQATIQQQNIHIDQQHAEVSYQPLRSFHQFPKLLVEIRSMIWRYALPRPRLVRVVSPWAMDEYLGKDRSNSVTLYIDRNDGVGRIDATGFAQLQEWPTASTHALLSICRESRQIALKTYDFAFSTRARSTSSFVEVTDNNPLTQVHRILGKDNPPRIPLIERLVSLVEIARQGIRFQPNHDTIYFLTAGSDVWGILAEARADEFRTANIKSLAIRYGVFEQLAHLLLGFYAPSWSGLRELIVIVAEIDGQTSTIDISAAPEVIRQQVESYQEKDPQIRFPVVRVMTEAMLVDYIEG